MIQPLTAGPVPDWREDPKYVLPAFDPAGEEHAVVIAIDGLQIIDPLLGGTREWALVPLPWFLIPFALIAMAVVQARAMRRGRRRQSRQVAVVRRRAHRRVCVLRVDVESTAAAIELATEIQREIQHGFHRWNPDPFA